MRSLFYGVPLEQRHNQQKVPFNSIYHLCFPPGDRGLLFITSLFVESDSLGYLNLSEREIHVEYLVFEGEGHDVLPYANQVTCYTSIAEFFQAHL